MKTARRIIAIFVSLAVITVAAGLIYMKVSKPEVNAVYPYVLVHGLNGWGDDSNANDILPYWGGETGDLPAYLNAQGFECYAPSIGPMSSAWDRACELYAALTGTQVDYGAAHSEKYGHDRYGEVYEKPLFEGWGAEGEDGLKKVNLVAHSFGGATVRTLVELLMNGSAEEYDATPDDLSPLFQGGKDSWVYSVTTLSAPHNGTTLFYAVGDGRKLVDGLFTLADLLSNTRTATLIKEIFPASGNSYNFTFAGMDLDTMLKLCQTPDSAFYDLTLDGAAELNERLHTSKEIYYFSYSVDGTKDATVLGGKRIPTDDVMLALMPTTFLMGVYDKNTVTDIEINSDWLPNDGLVNTISAKAPFNEASTEYRADNIKKGVWNIMPTVRGDHGSIIGMFDRTDEANLFYVEHLKLIEAIDGI